MPVPDNTDESITSIYALLTSQLPDFAIYTDSEATLAIDDTSSVVITEDTTYYVGLAISDNPGQEEDGPGVPVEDDGPGGMVEEG